MQQKAKDAYQLDKKIQQMKQNGFSNSKNKHTKFSKTSMATQVVVELVSGVIVGVGIGYILNEIFDFGTIFLIIFVIIGGLAGCLNISRYLKSYDEDKDIKNG